MKDEETLIYVLLDPDHWKDGALMNTAFKKSELQRGTLSVCRASYASAAVIEESIVKPQIGRDPRRTFVGAFKARCADIRAIHMGNPAVRLFCVIDDGLPGFEAHAVVGFSEPTAQNNFWQSNQRVAARSNLMLAFSTVDQLPLPLEECFS